MGCAVNLDIIKENVMKPISPAIGLISQYLFMPLVSFCIPVTCQGKVGRGSHLVSVFEASFFPRVSIRMELIVWLIMAGMLCVWRVIMATFFFQISYGLGFALFYSRPELWLGLFLTGCAPGGGGSNMWTYILGGSLDLSICMTFFSTIFAFAAVPLWTWALGPSIFPGDLIMFPLKGISGNSFALKKE